MDLSAQNFANFIDQALGFKLTTPFVTFDPYLNTINYLIASYMIPYVGLTGYVGTLPALSNIDLRSVRTHIFPPQNLITPSYIRILWYNRKSTNTPKFFKMSVTNIPGILCIHVYPLYNFSLKKFLKHVFW